MATIYSPNLSLAKDSVNNNQTNNSASNDSNTSSNTNSNNSNSSKFKPVPDQTSPRETRGAGSRGGQCDRAVNSELTLFHPLDRVGLTSKAHPDFILHLSDVPSVPLRFAIFDIESSQALIYRKVRVESKGLIHLSIPNNIPEMEIGKEYLFTVGLICKEEEPMKDIAEQVYIKRVAIPESVSGNETKQLDYFQDKNIWYDATFKLFQNKNSLASRNSMLEKLLEQAELFDPEFLSARLSLLDVSVNNINSSYLKESSVNKSEP